nr:hypothetical protein [Tanacetum cinerariifolium]
KELPSEDDLLTLIKKLGYSGKCIFGKSTGLDRLMESQDCQIYGAVIPYGMINDNIKLSKAYKTYLDYAIGKVPPKKERKFKKPTSPNLKTVPTSPKEHTQKAFQNTADVPEIYMHQFWNTIKKIGKIDGYNFKMDKKKCRVDIEEDFMYQVDNREICSARKEYTPYPRITKVIIDHFISKDNTISMTNNINLYTVRDDTLLAYKTYLDYAIGKVPPKKERKFKKPTSPKLKTVPTSPKEHTQKGKRVKRPAKKATTIYTLGVVIKDTQDKSVSKNKSPANIGRGKGIELLSDVALLEEAQLRETMRKRKQEAHKLQTSGSSEGVNFESEVLNEHSDKTKDTSEGTGVKPGVSNVSKEDSSDSDDDAWVDSEDESDDIHDEDDNDNDDGIDDDNGNDGDGDYKEEEQDDENVLTLEKDRYENEDKMYEEEDDDITEGPLQSSSISSNFTRKILNLNDSSLNINCLMSTSTVPPLPPPVYPSLHPTKIPQQQTPDSTTTTTTYLATTLPEIPNFASLFQFDQRVFAFETKVLEFNQTSQFAEAISLIQGIVDNYLASKLKEEVNVEVRLQINKLKVEAELENQEFINKLDSNMKKIIKEQVKAQVSKIMPQIEDHVTETLRAEVLVRSTNQPQTFYSVPALLSKFELKNILIDKMETNELINRSDIQRNLYNALVESYNIDKDILSTYGDVVTLKRGRDDQYKDEDSFARSDRGTKRRKSSKDVEPSKGSKSKESKSSSSSKGTQSQYKSSSKSTQAEEPEFEAVDIKMHQDQGIESSHIDDQPDNEAAPKHD